MFKSALITALLLVVVIHAQSIPSKHISCVPQSNVGRFEADLDYTGWAPGSGYFAVVNASITDNYNNGQLICVGNDFKSDVNCVGFDNGLNDAVFYVSVVVPADESLAYSSYKMLMGQPGPLAGQKWPCTIV